MIIVVERLRPPKEKTMEKQIKFYKEQIEKCRAKALEFRSKNDTKMYLFYLNACCGYRVKLEDAETLYNIYVRG